LAPRVGGKLAAKVEPIYFSETMPGPYVQYQGGKPTDLIAALRDWREMTSQRSWVGTQI
jgi:hypothetical protein